MFNRELIAQNFCFWLADNLRAGNLQKDEAEKLVLSFQFGLTKSLSVDDLISYLEGASENFPLAAKFISRLAEGDKKEVESEHKNTIVEFAQKFMGEPGIVDFLDEANKTPDLNILAEKFPKFKEFFSRKNS